MSLPFRVATPASPKASSRVPYTVMTNSSKSNVSSVLGMAVSLPRVPMPEISTDFCQNLR